MPSKLEPAGAEIPARPGLSPTGKHNTVPLTALTASDRYLLRSDLVTEGLRVSSRLLNGMHTLQSLRPLRELSAACARGTSLKAAKLLKTEQGPWSVAECHTDNCARHEKTPDLPNRCSACRRAMATTSADDVRHSALLPWLIYKEVWSCDDLQTEIRRQSGSSRFDLRDLLNLAIQLLTQPSRSRPGTLLHVSIGSSMPFKNQIQALPLCWCMRVLLCGACP